MANNLPPKIVDINKGNSNDDLSIEYVEVLWRSKGILFNNFFRFEIDKKKWSEKKYIIEWREKYSACDDFEILHSFLVRNNLYIAMIRRVEGDVLGVA